MSFYRGQYRVEPSRWRSWDYRSDGIYFITICCKDRRSFFGTISEGKMLKNELGVLAEKYWTEIPTHFPNIELDEYVIMPNHMHGILGIKNQGHFDVQSEDPHLKNLIKKTFEQDLAELLDWEDFMYATETLGVNPRLTQVDRKKMSEISPKKGSIASVIRSYKSAVSKDGKLINPNFQWDTRYYDVVVKDPDFFGLIKDYIINNPKNWLKKLDNELIRDL